MEGVEPNLIEAAKFIGEEIIRDLVKTPKKKKKSWLSLNKIGTLFTNLIGVDEFQAFKRCLMVGTTNPDVDKVWKGFVNSIPAILVNRKGKFSCNCSISPRVKCKELLGNLSNTDYKEKHLSEMLKLLLDGDLSDVNIIGKNGNTVLHLLASLPMETPEVSKFQLDLMEMLVKNNPDCSIKNDQNMTALHIIAGNYLLDPVNGFVLSQQHNFSSEQSIGKQSRKLSCIENIIDKPFQVRGLYGNSILHEWVISCTMVDQYQAQTSSLDIGNWITTIAGVSPNIVNDHGCTPLHYAFTDYLIEFLCENGAVKERKNDKGDTPLMFVVKHYLIRKLVDMTLSSRLESEETLAYKFYILSSGIPCLQSITSTTRSFITRAERLFEVQEKESFDFSQCDNTNRDCLDYLLLFVIVFVTKYDIQNDLVLIMIRRWIMQITKKKEDGNAKEKTLHAFILAFFKCKFDIAQDFYEDIEKLLCGGADPNNSAFGDEENILLFSCGKVLLDFGLHMKLLTLLCEYGADLGVKNKDGMTPIDILNQRGLNGAVSILKSTKPKQRVKISIQSQRYRNQVDQLSRERNPRKIEECRYDMNEIGRGSMGNVFLGIDEKGKREVALKRVLKTSFDKEITAEIQTLTQLEQNHHAINFYFVKEDENFYFIALELMDGDLEDLVKTERFLLQSNQDKIRYKSATDISRGLEFLHEKDIIHRDLKPGNILYREKPKFCLKLADFGLAKHLNVTSSCQTSVYHTARSSTSLCGTRGWMAPELIKREEKTPTKESDMFTLGLVLHFLFSKGFHPFHSHSSSLFRDIAADNLIPHELERSICQGNLKIHQVLNPEQRHLIECLLNKNPQKRPPSNGLIKRHCYFWSNLKKVYFMWKVGDQPEVAKPSSVPSSTFESELQNTSFGLSITNWNVPISPLYQEVASRRRYNTSSVVELIRFFRNCYAHFEERSPDRKEELLKDNFFMIFPKFLLTVCEAVHKQGWTNPRSGKDWLLRMLNEMD